MARFDFEELVERLPLVVYVDKLDDKSSPLYISPQIANLMGYSQEEWLADPDLFTASLHPDDRERVLAYLVERNAGLSGSTTMFLDYRLIARDGRVVWIRDDEIVVLDEAGRPTAAQGYMQDVTERRHDSRRLELLVGILSLAADETPPDEIVAAAAQNLAAAVRRRRGHLRRAPQGGWLLDPLHDRQGQAGVLGPGRVVGRVRQAPQQRAAHHRRRRRRKPGSTRCASAFSSAASPPRWTCRCCATARSRASSGSTARGRGSGATTKSLCSSTSRASSRSCSRTPRPASSVGAPSATCATATRSSVRSAARPSAFSRSRTSTKRSSS